MKAIFNPDEARRFAKWLNEECAELGGDLRQVNVQMMELMDRWHDPKFVAYSTSFDRDSEAIFRFIQLAEGFAEYLRRQADEIEEYLSE